jgi:hypothetical protein
VQSGDSEAAFEPRQPAARKPAAWDTQTLDLFTAMLPCPRRDQSIHCTVLRVIACISKHYAHACAKHPCLRC